MSRFPVPSSSPAQRAFCEALASAPRAGDKLTALQELHNKAYAKDATLRAMLFDLKSLDVVRVIEDVDAAPTGAATPEEAEE